MKPLQRYTIELIPMDSLFFRNGKPFSSGEDTWAETSVLPNPSVIWGALFSTMLFEDIVTLQDKELLNIKSVLLQRSESQDQSSKILIPAPLDLFQEKGKSKSYSETYISRNDLCSNHSTPLDYLIQPHTSQKVENAAYCFVDWLNFVTDYPLQNGATRIYESRYFNQQTAKIGISRSNQTRSSEEGRFYRVEMATFDTGWKFIVDFEAPADFPKKGILKLGGEGKLAAYKLIPTVVKPLPILADESCWFKIYFQTPAFFTSGDGIQEFAGLKTAKLASACVGRPLMIGGFDVAEREPKPMRKAVPAGSVYFLEGNPAETIKSINCWFEKKDLREGFNQFQVIKISSES